MREPSFGDTYKTKKELVYDYLRTNILRKHFNPGDKIIIRQISESLNVSDIPVREASKKLETRELLHVILHAFLLPGSLRKQSMKELGPYWRD